MDKNELLTFQKRIELDILTGCWIWKGGEKHSFYGYFKIKGKSKRAHRVSYEHWNGKIPEGLEIDHLCRVRRCVNPQHLEAVTHLENMRRAIMSKGNQYTDKTHCKRGHEFNEKNTNYSNNKRNCRVCHKIRCRGYRERNE